MDNDFRPYTLGEVLCIITAHTLNEIELDDETALRMVQFFPTYDDFIGKSLTKGMRIRHDGKLYEVRKPVTGITGAKAPDMDEKSYRLIERVRDDG